MPLIRAQFIDLSYDIDKHRKVLHEALQTQTRQAARAWLREVILHVPVWTGMAKGSLKPLGRFLRVAIPITRAPGAVPSASHNQAAGERQQSFSFDDNGVNYSFQWTTDVIHYQMNEFHESTLKLINPTPWNSTYFGNRAWKSYIDKILPLRIPNPSGFINASIIRADRR